MRSKPLNRDYHIVIWGGNAAESSKVWSFQITTRHAIHFDPQRDRPVDLDQENIRVYALFNSHRHQLTKHFLVGKEGGLLFIKITRGGSEIEVPVLLPSRSSQVSTLLPLVYFDS
jgi:hypothetical protein